MPSKPPLATQTLPPRRFILLLLAKTLPMDTPGLSGEVPMGTPWRRSFGDAQDRVPSTKEESK
jgi:hypothetical protein